jgi:predicted S18 family serine protease
MRTPAKTLSGIFTIVVMLMTIPCQAETSQPMGVTQWVRAQQIPILGVNLDADREVGSVAHLLVTVAERADSSGLAVVFPRSRGRLSPMAETSIQQGIYRTARVAGLSTDSWSVMVSVLDPDVTIHGSSLSAMVSITVLALAKGHTIIPERVITGTIQPDGHIQTVSGIPLKIEAAQFAHYRQVLVPEELSIEDGDWRTPFLMQVSPVRTIQQAYLGLTGLPLTP